MLNYLLKASCYKKNCSDIIRFKNSRCENITLVIQSGNNNIRYISKIDVLFKKLLTNI